MKKYLFSGLILALAVSMLPGCGKKESVADIMDKVDGSLKRYESTAMHISWNMEDLLTGEVSPGSIKTNLDCDIIAGAEENGGWCLSLDGGGDTESEGTRKPFSFKNYVVSEKGAIRTYTYEQDSRTWLYRDLPYQRKALEGQSFCTSAARTGILREKTAWTDGRECYVVEYTIKDSGKEDPFVFFIWETAGKLAEAKAPGMTRLLQPLTGGTGITMHAVLYISKENLLPCRWELEAEEYPKFSLTITCREFSSRPVTVPKEIILHAEEEYLSSIDQGRLNVDGTDPLYEKMEEEEQAATAKPPQTAFPDITDEEFEQALKELERLGWELE